MRKEKKQNRQKKIVLALLMLLVAGVALSTATYAWFSANTVVTAEDIDVKVTASAGISIAADAENFGKTISMTDVINFAKDKAYASTLQLPERLSPVSSAGNNGTADFKFYKGLIGEESTLVEASAVTEKTTLDENNFTGGDFIAFDIYIRSSLEQDIKLESNKTTIAKLGDNDAYLQSALRIGFLPLGTTTSAGDDQVKDSYGLNTPGTDYSIWNPYPTMHHSASLSKVDTYYGKDESEVANGYYAFIGESANGTDTKGENTGNYVPYYYSTVKALDDTPAYYKLIDSKNTNYFVGSESSIIPSNLKFTVGAGITKVRVYVWLEGQDEDCVDAISISDGLKINLGFEAQGSK